MGCMLHILRKAGPFLQLSREETTIVASLGGSDGKFDSVYILKVEAIGFSDGSIRV